MNRSQKESLMESMTRSSGPRPQSPSAQLTLGPTAESMSLPKMQDRGPALGAGHPVSVLLVEDNDSDYLMVSGFIADLQQSRPEAIEFQITRVTSFKDALEEVDGGGYDIVIIDLSLPDSTPTETLERLTRITDSAAVIVTSVVDDLEIALRAVNAGANDFLVKGMFDEELLLRSLLFSNERRRRQIELRQNEMNLLHVERLKSVGLLAGGVAHDFNNLLTALLGHVELLRMQMDADPAAQSHLDKMQGVIKAASRLTRQLLAYSGKSTQVKERIDINEALRNVISMIPSSVKKDSVLMIELSSAPLFVSAEASKLSQVFLNLIWNAYEASQNKRACITIRSSLGSNDGGSASGDGTASSGPREVVVEVSDLGCGMSSEVAGKMFDPYFSTKEGGRGLGLASVWGIVRSLGGKIQVDSVLGEGTTISVRLPELESEGAGAKDALGAASPPVDVVSGPVLVVDDEDAVREVIAQLFDGRGIDVEVASDGASALKLLEENPGRFQFALMDVSMPGMNGFEVYDRIRAAGLTLPIIFMSGFHSAEDPMRPKGDPLIDFVGKPFQMKEVLDAVVPLLRASA